jgi:GT2 family glycosyltransferase
MLSLIVLSFNRRAALARTLRELGTTLATLTVAHETIVVDNASEDGTVAMLTKEFPGIEVLALQENVGVAAFNRAAERARGDLLLILDDDAWPDTKSLAAALERMHERANLGAVALLPVHPVSGLAEWPFLSRARGGWPVLGCGNLVRASAWKAVGGYEESFFLYRNDTDLAMKLLAGGYDVFADPEWIVWHDSPHAGRKSERWLELATRNWVLLARRHARGWRLPFSIVLGWAWACRQAGLSLPRLRLATRGALVGLGMRVPALVGTIASDGTAFAELLRLQVGSRNRGASRRPLRSHPGSPGVTTDSSMTRHSP